MSPARDAQLQYCTMVAGTVCQPSHRYTARCAYAHEGVSDRSLTIYDAVQYTVATGSSSPTGWQEHQLAPAHSAPSRIAAAGRQTHTLATSPRAKRGGRPAHRWTGPQHGPIHRQSTPLHPATPDVPAPPATSRPARSPGRRAG